MDLVPFDSPRFVHLDIDTVDRLEAFLARREAHARDFVRVVYSGPGSMLVKAAELVGDAFRSYQFIHRRATAPSERRADVHAGMSRREILTRYYDARPLAGVDREVTLAALFRLACATDE